MGDGTEQNPYTREDVLRLIQENGGRARGLDLSGKWFKGGIDPSWPNLYVLDLSGLDLSGIILKDAVIWYANLEGAELEEVNLEGANLYKVNLKGANLYKANLKGAFLNEANLEGAKLEEVNLEGANLSQANLKAVKLWGVNLKEAELYESNLEGASLNRVSFSHETELETTKWGDYILQEEIECNFGWAEDIYRRLKQWYTNAGVYDIAGEFFFREMTAQRKRIRWWPYPTRRKRINWWLHPRHRAWSKFVSLICGYGERPHRVIIWAASWILGLTIIYFLLNQIWDWAAFIRSLYFSAVSFTALGYGGWLQETNNWVKGIGAFESFIGVFTIALFLVTFTRKMRR